jgi:hypothetical protein
MCAVLATQGCVVEKIRVEHGDLRAGAILRGSISACYGCFMHADEMAKLGEEIAESAAVIDAATHRFLTQLREFDAIGGWHVAGAQSCAHWLSWRVGMDLGAAREKVRVARALEGLPKIDDALKGAEISYSKVRAMTRVATAENEATLLGMARETTGSQLEKICRLTRQVQALYPQGHPIPPQGERPRWAKPLPVVAAPAAGWDGWPVQYDLCVEAALAP